MTYQRREQSAGNLYHVTIRGSGRRLIFEDDIDRGHFAERLENGLRENPVELYAWCLMGNHAHFLLHGDITEIARFMEGLEKSYVKYFNRRHDCVGHLLQGRYGSVPIKSDAQLMETIRYIHRNPIKAGISQTCSYRWCSYDEYRGSPRMVSPDFVLSVFGDAGEFERFHRESASGDCLAKGQTASARMSEAAAIEMLASILVQEGLHEVPVSDKTNRNRVIVLLKDRGVSVRQIERLTGIGRNIIVRAK